MSEQFNEFNAGLSDASKALSDLQRDLGQINSVIGQVVNAFGDLAGSIPLVGNALKEITDGLEEAMSAANKMIDVFLEVGQQVAEFGGKIIEATTALGNWVLSQAGAQQDFKRGFQSILGQDVGDRLYRQLLALAPRVRGTQQDLMEIASVLISNPAFRPTTAGGQNEFNRMVGLLTDIQAGGNVDRTHLQQIMRIVALGEPLTRRNQLPFSQAGLPIADVAAQFHMSQESFMKALRAGSISSEDFAHTLERMDVALRHTGELGEYAITTGSQTIGGILQNLSDLPKQLFANWLESLDTANNSTYEGTGALYNFVQVLNQINTILTTPNEYPQYFQAITDIFNELIEGIFGPLGISATNLGEKLLDFLYWIRDVGVPTFLGAKDAAVAFFEGIWDGLQPLRELFASAFGANARSTAEQFREFGRILGDTISRLAPRFLELFHTIEDGMPGLIGFTTGLLSLFTVISNFFNAITSFFRIGLPTTDTLSSTDNQTDRTIAQQWRDSMNSLGRGTGFAGSTTSDHLLLNSTDLGRIQSFAHSINPGRSATDISNLATDHLNRDHAARGPSQSIVSNQRYIVSPGAINLHFDVRDHDNAHEIATQVRQILPTALAESIERTFVAGGI